jgi:DNA-binding NarL/FixJ family response regulator
VDGVSDGVSGDDATPPAREAGTLKAVRVVVADDHPIWRSGLRADLGENFHVVGEAGDAAEAVSEIARARPDLVVCDLHMPGGGGIEVAKACGQQVPIVILTVSEAERDLLDAVAAGAAGYLVKSTAPDELRRELWKAARGEPVFSPSLAALVLGEFRRLAKAAGPVQPLSDREREVLQYVARGHTYREIGEELSIAEKTVENHVRNILGKLHLNRRQELVRYALDHGIE